MIVFTNFQVGVLSDKTLIRDLAHVILAHDHFARDAAGRLFRYDGGVYTENAELYVKRQVKQLTVKFANAGRWNRTLAHEVIEYIALDAPELLERPDPGQDQPDQWHPGRPHGRTCSSLTSISAVRCAFRLPTTRTRVAR